MTRQVWTEEMTGTLASGTFSRRGALKLMGGAALGLLVLPVIPSTASAAGKLQLPLKTSLLGTFGGVKYVQYDGLFVGKTLTGNYSVPYRISAPANRKPVNRPMLQCGFSRTYGKVLRGTGPSQVLTVGVY